MGVKTDLDGSEWQEKVRVDAVSNEARGKSKNDEVMEKVMHGYLINN